MNLPVITKNMSNDELDELVDKATNASAFLKAISHEGRPQLLLKCQGELVSFDCRATATACAWRIVRAADAASGVA